MEALRLRVKDVDFSRGEVLVREGKGFKDRVTMLPQIVVEPLQAHLAAVREMHRADLEAGYGEVYLPYALNRKYPSAGREWGWQYVFPSVSRSTDPRSGIVRRHHSWKVSEAPVWYLVAAQRHRNQSPRQASTQW